MAGRRRDCFSRIFASLAKGKVRQELPKPLAIKTIQLEFIQGLGLHSSRGDRFVIKRMQIASPRSDLEVGYVK
jgi:hypothetical protein